MNRPGALDCTFEVWRLNTQCLSSLAFTAPLNFADRLKAGILRSDTVEREREMGENKTVLTQRPPERILWRGGCGGGVAPLLGVIQDRAMEGRIHPTILCHSADYKKASMLFSTAYFSRKPRCAAVSILSTILCMKFFPHRPAGWKLSPHVSRRNYRRNRTWFVTYSGIRLLSRANSN